MKTQPPSDLPGRLWTALKLCVIAALVLPGVAGWILVFQGETPSTRRATSGLFVAPLFAVFYCFQFKKLQPTFWSVISHLGLIASLLALLGSIWMNRNHQDEFFDNPLYLWGGVVGGILLFAVSVGGIAHAAGFRAVRKRPKDE